MKQNLNIEAEGSELILKNKAGDHVIIPKKYRREVQDMLKENCHNCIDDLVETLPTMADYAQNGSIYPVDKNGKQIRKETYTQWGERIKKLAPNLDYKKEDSGYNYRGAYEGGLEPEYNKEDNSYHLGSRNPITGEILKSENHPSFKESVNADMAMGYETYRGKDGKIYSHDKKYLNANKNKVKEYLGTYNGNVIQAASVTADAPTWAKYRQEYIKNNSFNLDEYVENRFNNPIGRETIKKINAEGWKKELRQEGIEKRTNAIMDYVGEQLVKNKPQGKLSRAEWLNTMSDREESIIKRNPKYQSSLWADTKRGLTSLVEQNPLQTFRNILNSSDFSNREKQEMLKDYTTHPIMSKLGDATKVLNPLIIPTKMTQSTYKDNYSVLDAMKGKKNNAGIMEDLITDPLNFIGAGLIGKLSKVDKAVDATKAGRNLIKPVSKVVDKVDYITENLKHLEYAKNYYSKYGYNIPENLAEIAKNSKLTDEIIQGLVNQHNTFVRGVSTNWDEIAKKNPEILRHLEGKGIDYINNPQAAAEYMATHVPIQTGYGRAGFGKNNDAIDAIYTSNSIPTAEGYTYGDGFIVKVKRPTNFSSKNRLDWINNNVLDYDEINKISNEQSFNDLISLKTYYQNNIDKIDDILPSNYPLNKQDIHNLPKILQDEQVEKILREVIPKEKQSLSGIDGMKKPIRKMEAKIDIKSNNYYDLIDDIEDDVLYNKVTSRLAEKEKELNKKFNNLIDESSNYEYGSFDWYKSRLKYQEEATRIISENKSEYIKTLQDEFGITPNRYAHYLHIGKEGEKLLEPIEAIRITPDIWKNKSRAHTNVFSKGLSAGSLIPFYLYLQSQNQNQNNKK